LHHLFTGHNVYRRVKTIVERSKSGEWSIEDEGEYEKIDQDFTRSMLSAAKSMGIEAGNKHNGHQRWAWQLNPSGIGM
jgi:hypothetical protein